MIIYMKIQNNASRVNISKLLDIYIYDSIPNDVDDYFKYSSKNIIDDVRYIILKHLDESERRVLILYAEKHNYAEIGRLLNCSANAIKKYIIKIQDKIISEIKCY